MAYVEELGLVPLPYVAELIVIFTALEIVLPVKISEMVATDSLPEFGII